MKRIEGKGQSRTSYKGALAQQNPNAFNEFAKFLDNESFDYVIEIGTSYGGFALFLHEQSLKHKFKFSTYDWSGFRNGSFANRISDLKALMPLGILPFDYRDKSVFESDPDKHAVKEGSVEGRIQGVTPLTEIVDILLNNKCLLLCDGGDKVKEFNIFGKYLTPDSYIMAHDYASNKNNFKEEVKDKIWNWFEIQDSDVQLVMNEYNIVKSKYYEQFSSVAWLQCIKEK